MYILSPSPSLPSSLPPPPLPLPPLSLSLSLLPSPSASLSLFLSSLPPPLPSLPLLVFRYARSLEIKLIPPIRDTHSVLSSKLRNKVRWRSEYVSYIVYWGNKEAYSLKVLFIQTKFTLLNSIFTIKNSILFYLYFKSIR